jgi:hypothetical protein
MRADSEASPIVGQSNIRSKSIFLLLSSYNFFISNSSYSSFKSFGSASISSGKGASLKIASEAQIAILCSS